MFFDKEIKMKLLAVRKKILEMIPYGEDIVFLDKVSLNRKNEHVGEFTVTESACGGGSHLIGGKYLLFRGVDVLEMIVQFLGIVWATQNPKFSKGKLAVLAGIKKLSLKNPIYVNDSLKIVVIEDNINHKILGDLDDMSAFVIGKNITVFKKKHVVATVGSITLMVAPPEILGLAEK